MYGFSLLLDIRIWQRLSKTLQSQIFSITYLPDRYRQGLLFIEN